MILDLIKYVSWGYSIIPVSRTTKKPLIHWKLYQKRLPKKTNVLKWFNGRARNAAVVCGPISGNLIVIDFDSIDYYREVAHFLGDEAPTVRTKKGFHVYFKSKGDLKYRNTKIAFDNDKVLCEIRANGGYALVPPSFYGSGHYAFIRGGLDTVPVLDDGELEFVIDSISTEKPKKIHTPSYNGSHSGGSKVIAVVEKEPFVRGLLKKNFNMARSALVGDRNNQLFRSSCYLGELIAGGHIDAKDHVYILYDIAKEIGLLAEDGTESVTKTISSGLQRGMENPMIIEEDSFMKELGF